ncbi:hypothetical protein SAMN05421504_1097 [Amycolatopsis xylanica]|uniref:Uncharacterized protein n=1 Tax=Amycolatopsis xylanica TaxID=589385 RepID=A0A1H3PYQ8_9PSEU|nr:hypothetical protein [Amycolatopsis xylanica]SDZ06444.1 hypothetical protein SAMN05421504_1097 [Amycolatopsis xylanica]
MSDFMMDAVQAEVAYRTEQLQRAGRSAWVDRADRLGRRLRARWATEVKVPEQERRAAERVTADQAR